MPIRSYARPEYNLRIVVQTGQTTDSEFIAFYESLYANGQSEPPMNLLVDLRQADSTSRSSDALFQVAEFIQDKIPSSSTRQKVAVVAPNDVSFGLARMCESFADPVPWDFVVYRDMKEALAWLDAPEDLLDEDIQEKES